MLPLLYIYINDVYQQSIKANDFPDSVQMDRWLCCGLRELGWQRTQQLPRLRGLCGVSRLEREVERRQLLLQTELDL